MKHFVDPNDPPIEPPTEPLDDMPFLAMDDLPEESFDNSSSSQTQGDLGNQHEVAAETRFDTTRATANVESAELIDNETVFSAENYLTQE